MKHLELNGVVIAMAHLQEGEFNEAYAALERFVRYVRVCEAAHNPIFWHDFKKQEELEEVRVRS